MSFTGSVSYQAQHISHETTLLLITCHRFKLRIEISGRLTKGQRRALALALIRQNAGRLEQLRGLWIHHRDAKSQRSYQYIHDAPSLNQAPQFHDYFGRIGMAIRMRRLEAGLTQYALAKLARINTSHLSQLERGNHKARPETLKRLQDILGIELMSGQTHQKPDEIECIIEEAHCNPEKIQFPKTG